MDIYSHYTKETFWNMSPLTTYKLLAPKALGFTFLSPGTALYINVIRWKICKLWVIPLLITSTRPETLGNYFKVLLIFYYSSEVVGTEHCFITLGQTLPYYLIKPKDCINLCNFICVYTITKRNKIRSTKSSFALPPIPLWKKYFFFTKKIRVLIHFAKLHFLLAITIKCNVHLYL